MERGFLIIIKIHQRRIITYDDGAATLPRHYPCDGQLRRHIGSRLQFVRDSTLRSREIAACRAAARKKEEQMREAVISSRYCSRIRLSTFATRPARLDPSFFRYSVRVQRDVRRRKL